MAKQIMGLILAVLLFFCGFSYAEMQTWTGEDGVVHFSNAGAPQDAEVQSFNEIEYDEKKAARIKQEKETRAFEEAVHE